MELLTVSEIAAILKMHAKTVYRLIWKGKIPATKLGKNFRIKKEDLEEMVENGVITQDKVDEKKRERLRKLQDQKEDEKDYLDD